MNRENHLWFLAKKCPTDYLHGDYEIQAHNLYPKFVTVRRNFIEAFFDNWIKLEFEAIASMKNAQIIYAT